MTAEVEALIQAIENGILQYLSCPSPTDPYATFEAIARLIRQFRAPAGLASQEAR